jgi:hypothetical protein
MGGLPVRLKHIGKIDLVNMTLVTKDSINVSIIPGVV